MAKFLGPTKMQLAMVAVGILQERNARVGRNRTTSDEAVHRAMKKFGLYNPCKSSLFYEIKELIPKARRELRKIAEGKEKEVPIKKSSPEIVDFPTWIERSHPDP